MTNGIISLESLITFVKEKDRAGDSLHGASAAGKVLGRKIGELTKGIETGRGFYLWGNYNEKRFWKNIYLGKAGYGKHAGLRKRIIEELSDERCFLWIGILTEDEILRKGAGFYPAKWSKYEKEWRHRFFKKAETSHIVWVATPNIGNSHVHNVEADLIETLNTNANISRPTPPSELQRYTKEIIGQFRQLIHAQRPLRSARPTKIKRRRFPSNS